MKILINPQGMSQGNYTPPPLGLLYMAAMAPDTIIYDAALLKTDGKKFIDNCKNLEIVGVPIYTIARHQSLSILKYAKEHGAITVAGGPHVSIMSEQLKDNYPFVDYWVVGDGEFIWQTLCNNPNSLKKGIVHSKRIEDLDVLSLPAWEKVDIMAYPSSYDDYVSKKHHNHNGNNLSVIPRISIILGRGCIGKCNFCSTWWVHGKYRTHGKDWMGRHLQKLWDLGIRHLVFQDDCLTVDRKAITDLCDILKKYSFSWFGTTRVDCIDLELAKQLRDAGCYNLSFGIENGSQSILDKMNKHIPLEQSFKARDACNQTGICFTALCINGYPGETPETRSETDRFLKKLNPDAVGTLGHVMVLPGTVLYQQCKREKLINDDFWLSPQPYYAYQKGLK